MGHLEFGDNQPLLWIAGIDTFVLSLVLTPYAREKTGSIWTSVGIHAYQKCRGILGAVHLEVVVYNCQQ